jgi:hypothetical protein
VCKKGYVKSSGRCVKKDSSSGSGSGYGY